MEKKEILVERERCKKIVIRKIESVMKYRREKIRHRKRRIISVFEKLLKDILFLINNPNYIRKKD